MMGHNISFKGVLLKIIPKLSLLPLLIWSTGLYMLFTPGVNVNGILRH